MAKKTTSTKSKTKTAKKSALNSQKTPQQKHLYKPFIVFAIGFILLIISVFIFRGVFIAASVNGETINRIVVVKELEKQNGKSVLENLITQKLILQEAKKRGLEVTNDEVNSEIKKIEESLSTQGTTLDQALQLQGIERNQLIKEIRIQRLAQKMVEGDTEITDKEIEDFVTQNKAQFPEATTDAQMKEQAKEALTQQKLQEKTQSFLEDLRTKAIIKNYVSY